MTLKQQIKGSNTQMQTGQLVFFSFCFNTKIQSYHTSPSQIFTFHIRTKIRGKVEEKRLGVGRWGAEKEKYISGAQNVLLAQWRFHFCRLTPQARMVNSGL